MSAALMLVHRGIDGMVVNMPFTYRTGEMMAVVEEVADYIAGMELVDSLWEAIAADRLRVILEQRVEIADLKHDLDMFTVKPAGAMAL